MKIIHATRHLYSRPHDFDLIQIRIPRNCLQTNDQRSILYTTSWVGISKWVCTPTVWAVPNFPKPTSLFSSDLRSRTPPPPPHSATPILRGWRRGGWRVWRGGGWIVDSWPVLGVGVGGDGLCLVGGGRGKGWWKARGSGRRGRQIPKTEHGNFQNNYVENFLDEEC